MPRSTPLYVLFFAAALLLASTEAFTMQPGRSVEGAQSRAASKKMLASILKMADGDEPGKISNDGTFYDDEVSNKQPVCTKIYRTTEQREQRSHNNLLRT